MIKKLTAQRQWIVVKTAKLKQPIYFKSIRTSEYKSKNCSAVRRVMLLLSQKQKTMYFFKIVKDQN